MMTHLFSSSLALPLALALALSAAGGIAAFTSQADAANAHTPASVRCFLGGKADTKHGREQRLDLHARTAQH